MSQNPRIEELRRRVQADPASIAFAALAEEYRRDGNFTDAIDTCVAGLKRHPSYLSAHVTLGRALIEVGRFEEAEQELQLVLKAAPENLAAIRGMAEIHHRRRDHGYDEASSALSALEHHDHKETPAAQEVTPAEPAFEPPVFQPPVFQPPAFEAPAPATASYDASGYVPISLEGMADEPTYEAPRVEAPQYEPASYEPAQYEAPQYQPQQYEQPQYDPPGTFEFPAAAAAPAYEVPTPAVSSPAGEYEVAAYDVAAYEAPAAVAEHHSPQLDALERFLDAITASRVAIPAH